MNGRPKIGALRRRVTLEAPVDAPDDAGGFLREFAPVAQLWAKIEATGAGEQFAEQRLEQSRTLRVTIRWRAGVTSQMRFDLQGRKLYVRGVLDVDEAGRFLRCDCEELS